MPRMKQLDEPLASVDGDVLEFFPTGQSAPFYGTRADAERLLRQLDEDLHPWGKPGERPTEPGPVLVLLQNGFMRPAELLKSDEIPGEVPGRLIWGWAENSGGYTRWSVAEQAAAKNWRFRKRWTPDPPPLEAS